MFDISATLKVIEVEPGDEVGEWTCLLTWVVVLKEAEGSDIPRAHYDANYTAGYVAVDATLTDDWECVCTTIGLV